MPEPSETPDTASPTHSRASAFEWALVLLLMAAALFVRLSSIDFALPFFQESDAHVFRQVHLLSLEELTPELIKESSIYPHLLPRIVNLFPDPVADPPDPDHMTVEEHLEWAGGMNVLVRSIVAIASVLLIPAAWLLARRLFSPGWALFAAALCALSLLNLQFGQLARPHAFAAPFPVLAVAAAVRLRRNPDLTSWLLCSLAGALAVASLQSGLAVGFPFLVAFLFRARRPGSSPLWHWLDWKLVLPLGLIFLATWFFWPFAYVDVPGAETGMQDGTIRISDQSMALSEFTGEGFTTVFLTLWYYESATFVLAGLGLALLLLHPLLVRLGRATPLRTGRLLDLAVIAAYAVPYLITIGMHERAQQRFVIPLIPFAVLLATHGLSGTVRLIAGTGPHSRRLAQFAGGLALAVPLAATASYVRLHETPHTQGAAGEWLAANASPDDFIGVHLTYDVPLARRLENLFVDGNPEGPRRPGMFYTSWQHHQCTHMGPDWEGQRWNVESLYVPAETDLAAVQADPEAWLRVKGYKYVVVPGEHGASFHPMLEKVRLAAANIGTLMMRAPDGERMRVKTKYEGLDTPHYTAFVLTAPQLGPELEIYRIDPPRGR